MKFTQPLRGHLLVADCGPDLAAQAAVLLKLAAEADAAGNGLRDGFVIEFGWAPLRVWADRQEWVLCEPDYAGDPWRFVPTVDATLRVLAGQAAVLHALDVEGEVARYDRKVLQRRGSLSLAHLYLHRQTPVSEQDSGSYIGPADLGAAPPDESELEPLYIYQLVSRRPALLQVLALPFDYLAVFAGDTIEAILDPQGRPLWPPRADEVV